MVNLDMIRSLCILTFLIPSSLLMSCVSVQIAVPSSTKSTVAQYQSPKKPFEEQTGRDLDRLWRNSLNGNTISYLSDCENPTDPSLQSIFKGITSEIDNPKIIKNEDLIYNSREGLRSVVEGVVDGVKTRFELLIFKKNNCTYILTYAAVAQSFSENQKDFDRFLKDFKVP